MMTLVGAVSFVVAHEIFHKPGFFNKTLGTLHMSKVLYMHFSIEHLYGHHKHVATPADPATAQKGVTLYEFIPKSVKGSLLSAYNIEAKRDKPFYLNGAVLSIISSVLFVCLVYKFYNIQATLLFLAYAFGSIFFLESINYIEHYGLRREKLPNGQY
jgi:alkane 1-monooxygenase